MNSNFWYYSLSTISQTLAAIIALSATFIIFKLDILQRKRQDFLNEMIRFIMILNPGKENHNVDKLDDESISNLLDPISNLDKKQSNLGLSKKAYEKLFAEREIGIAQVRGKYPLNSERIFNYLQSRKIYFNKLRQVKTSAFNRLAISLILVASTIIISLFGIPLYECINMINLSFIVCFIIIILAAISIAITAINIWKIAKDDLN